MPSAKAQDAMNAVMAPPKTPDYDVDVAEPPPHGICYIPGHRRKTYIMYIALLAWVSFYVGISCFVAYRLPCWLHGIRC